MGTDVTYTSKHPSEDCQRKLNKNYAITNQNVMKDAVTELAMIVVFSIIMSLFIKDQEIKTSYYVFYCCFKPQSAIGLGLLNLLEWKLYIYQPNGVKYLLQVLYLFIGHTRSKVKAYLCMQLRYSPHLWY